jgi:hypothetical protein
VAAQNMRVLIAIFILIGLARNCFASDSWTCSYVGFGADSKSVTIQLLLRGDKLIDRHQEPMRLMTKSRTNSTPRKVH